MAILPFRKSDAKTSVGADVARILDDFSIEVMPRTAAKIEDFARILPASTRIYVAHIDGTPIEDMVDTARRLSKDGFNVMPHFPARSIAGEKQLRDWVKRYRDEAGIDQALVLAGSRGEPAGTFENSMQMLETGAFQDAGFTRIHVAGHPEGNRDIAADGGMRIHEEAILWKQEYASATSTEMAIVTQFAFDAKPVFTWEARLREIGVTLPVHLGIAGPTKLQTLIKFAIACGVGPSLSVLQKRAKDVTRLLQPFTPDDLLQSVADGLENDAESLIEKIHIFPLGGIRASAEYTSEALGASQSDHKVTGRARP